MSDFSRPSMQRVLRRRAADGVNISISIGAARSQSSSTQTSSTAAPCTVTAGRDVSITASGAGRESDLTVQGSRISAGRDATLAAAGDLNLLAAQQRADQHSTSGASSASIGVGFGFGAGGMGFGVTASAGRARGSADGEDVTFSNTQVEAGNTLALQSGGDTTLRGAVARGRQVTADLLGDLNIESLQDTSTFESRQRRRGGSITIGTAGVSGGANVGRSTLDSDFASVTEHSGIRAGDAGFQIGVRGHTGLVGGVITSTDKAAEEGRNRLTTGTLTQSDIQNRAAFDGQSVSLGAGFGQNVGRDQQGRAETGAGQTPGTTLPSLGGFSATPPIALGASEDAASTTRSGVSPAEIQITDEAKQQALTGKDAATTIASINRDVSTDRDTSGALRPIFNEQEIQAGFAVSGAFAREVGIFLGSRAMEADAKKAERDQAAAKGDAEGVRRAEAQLQELQKWAPGGIYRQITNFGSRARAEQFLATRQTQGMEVPPLEASTYLDLFLMIYEVRQCRRSWPRQTLAGHSRSIYQKPRINLD